MFKLCKKNKNNKKNTLPLAYRLCVWTPLQNSFTGKYMIHLEVKQQLVSFADLLKSKMLSLNPANY